MTCQGCKNGVPLYNGVHCGEIHMEACTSQIQQLINEVCDKPKIEPYASPLVLDPKSTDYWYGGKAKKKVKAPFRSGT